MNKNDYLNNKDVIRFIQWILPRISGEIKFTHNYTSAKTKKIWSCNSIYNAYEKYSWPFTCRLPDNTIVKGSTFKESEDLLLEIEIGMKKSIRNSNVDELLFYSKSMLDWGKVLRSNYNKLEKMGEDIVKYFQVAHSKLDLEYVDSNDCFDGVLMNSGFTKLYSLLVDNFIIYDSRVGAALGLLVKYFLEDNGYLSIPEVLNFSYGNSRPTKSDVGPINKRNPSSEKFKFSQLANNRKKHIKNNIYSSWLTADIASKSIFSNEENASRTLEAALFMIGYEVNSVGEL